MTTFLRYQKDSDQGALSFLREQGLHAIANDMAKLMSLADLAERGVKVKVNFDRYERQIETLRELDANRGSYYAAAREQMERVLGRIWAATHSGW